MLGRKWRVATVGAALLAGLVVAPSTASATGSGNFEIISVNANNSGVVSAYRNINSFNGLMFATPGVPVGSNWFDPAMVRFADINGDTWDDLIRLGPFGEVWAWPNNGGSGGYLPEVQIGTGFTPGRTTFADIDGDGRDEIIAFQGLNGQGDVLAWHNVNGFNGVTYPAGSQVIAHGFTPETTWFADIDGGGKDEIISMIRIPDTGFGDIWAWRNVNGGYTAGAVAIGRGWPWFEPSSIKFGDLNDDGRHEIIRVEFNGPVWAWRNVNGLAHDNTYTAGRTLIGQNWQGDNTFFAEVLRRS
jgi:hypothetical protein